jgi:hypothetical protein
MLEQMILEIVVLDCAQTPILAEAQIKAAE